MAAYVYPGNLNFRSIQSIPSETQIKLRQSANGVDAATKTQDLHVKVLIGGAEVDSTVTCTVSSVVATNSAGNVVPAYRVQVNGWTNDVVVSPDTITFVGGFPRSFTSDQNVNPTEASNVLPWGTVTVYEPSLQEDLCLFPSVSLIGGKAVALKDKAESEDYPTWNLVVSSYCPQESLLQFNFSFNLFVQPGTA